MRSAVRTAAVAILVPACALSCARHPEPDGLTGLGARRTVWNAHHGGGYSTVAGNAAGRVRGYVLALPPSTVDQAVARVRRDLPADAATGPLGRSSGVEGLQCATVTFTSPSVARALGEPAGSLVAAVLLSSTPALDPARITSAVVTTGGPPPAHGC